MLQQGSHCGSFSSRTLLIRGPVGPVHYLFFYNSQQLNRGMVLAVNGALSEMDQYALRSGYQNIILIQWPLILHQMIEITAESQASVCVMEGNPPFSLVRVDLSTPAWQECLLIERLFDYLSIRGESVLREIEREWEWDGRWKNFWAWFEMPKLFPTQGQILNLYEGWK